MGSPAGRVTGEWTARELEAPDRTVPGGLSGSDLFERREDARDGVVRLEDPLGLRWTAVSSCGRRDSWGQQQRSCKRNQ